MCDFDNEMKNLLESSRVDVEPDPVRMNAARQRMMQLAGTPRHTKSGIRMLLTLVLLLVGVSAMGIASTQAGRDLVRWVLTPVRQEFLFTHESAATTGGEVGTLKTRIWTGNSDHPLSTDEMEAMKARHAEMDRMQEEGGGRLVGLIEGPTPLGVSHPTAFLVEYTLSDGSTETVGQGIVEPRQKANLRVDELLALRDAGAGEIVAESPGSVGLGNFTIRFTLADGQSFDLRTNYPPGTRANREKIFTETRALKQQLRFDVEDPRGPQPDRKVWGLLRYTLADGRVVGITEEVPNEALTPDGKHVAVPRSEADQNSRHKPGNPQAEAESIMRDGGGTLVGLLEGPDFLKGSSSQRTMFLVDFTLSNGESFRLNEGSLSEKQRAIMRWDELSTLRDAGAGRLISQEPFHVGLGKYTVRFTLSDGQTVDLTVNYPPGTREDRERIFAETRELRKELRFEVMRPTVMAVGTFGVLRYTLTDGRTVGVSEIVPKEAIGSEGKLTVPVIEVP